MRRSFTRNDLLVRNGIVDAGIYGFISFGIPLSHSLGPYHTRLATSREELLMGYCPSLSSRTVKLYRLSATGSDRLLRFRSRDARDPFDDQRVSARDSASKQTVGRLRESLVRTSLLDLVHPDD
jgi:hypothetical protein